MKRSLIILIPAFIVLAACYAYATPIYESPDELKHVGMIHYIATYGELPVQDVVLDTQRDTWYEQEGSQPPLYYAITALLVRGIDRSDFESTRIHNPHAIIGNPSALGNQNMVLHDFPYPPRLIGTTLAVFVARGFSILLGCVTVFAVYHAAKTLMPDRPTVPVLAAGLVAFNPQFVFIAASANNDNMVTALNSLVIWQTLTMMRNGFDTRRSLVIAVLMAFASISKLSGLVVIPVVGLASLWTAYRTKNWRGLLMLGIFTIVAWGIIAAWWYMRNYTLYGEWFGTQTMLEIFGRRPAPTLIELIQNEFEGLRISFWGLFGWFNVFTFKPFYLIMDIVTVIALIGFAVYCWRIRRERDQGMRLAFLSMLIVIGLISLILWTMQTAASQGRLMFPYIAAITTVMALGLDSVRVPSWAVVPLAAFAFVVPFATILPTYSPPPMVTDVPNPFDPPRLYRDWNLMGYQVDVNRRYHAGDILPITLYWQPVRPSDDDYSLFIRLIDPDDNLVGLVTTYPGYGRLRTSTWQAGVTYADHYQVRLPQNLNGQYPLRAFIGWWKYPDGFAIDPVDENGNPLPLPFLDVGYVDAGIPAPQNTVDPAVDFGGLIRLTGYTLDGGSLTLHWEALQNLSASTDCLYVFVHVMDDARNLVAQDDDPPAIPTCLIGQGESFISRHDFLAEGTPPTGIYTVHVGWYSRVNPMRLSIDYLDNAYPLTEITIP